MEAIADKALALKSGCLICGRDPCLCLDGDTRAHSGHSHACCAGEPELRARLSAEMSKLGHSIDGMMGPEILKLCNKVCRTKFLLSTPVYESTRIWVMILEMQNAG